jgi:hypothetical protein
VGREWCARGRRHSRVETLTTRGRPDEPIDGDVTLIQRPNVVARQRRARRKYVRVARTGSLPVTARSGASTVRTFIGLVQRSTRSHRSPAQPRFPHSTREMLSQAISTVPAQSRQRRPFDSLPSVHRGSAGGSSRAREVLEDRHEAGLRVRAHRDVLAACPRGPAVAGERTTVVDKTPADPRRDRQPETNPR